MKPLLSLGVAALIALPLLAQQQPTFDHGKGVDEEARLPMRFAQGVVALLEAHALRRLKLGVELALILLGGVLLRHGLHEEICGEGDQRTDGRRGLEQAHALRADPVVAIGVLGQRRRPEVRLAAVRGVLDARRDKSRLRTPGGIS